MEPLHPTDPPEVSATEGLRAALRQALATSSTDEQLAVALVRSGAYAEITDIATVSSKQIAQQLGIQQASVRKLAHRAGSFPPPVVAERRWASEKIEQYGNRRRMS
jgi:DNA-directed RNA polymerase specialized sigma24 family protein